MMATHSVVSKTF